MGRDAIVYIVHLLVVIVFLALSLVAKKKNKGLITLLIFELLIASAAVAASVDFKH